MEHSYTLKKPVCWALMAAGLIVFFVLRPVSAAPHLVAMAEMGALLGLIAFYTGFMVALFVPLIKQLTRQQSWFVVLSSLLLGLLLITFLPDFHENSWQAAAKEFVLYPLVICPALVLAFNLVNQPSPGKQDQQSEIR